MSDLETIKKEYKELSQKLSASELVFGQTEKNELLKRKDLLKKIIEKEEEISQIKTRIQEDKSMTTENTDSELAMLARKEAEDLGGQEKNLQIELKNLLNESKKENSKHSEPNSIIVEIRAGAGGEEAALFAKSLFRMYSRYADVQGWKQRILNSRLTELGGYKEIIFGIKGKDAFSKMKFEAGVHRVQRTPETEKRGRIHTSTASVAVLSEPKEAQIKIKPSDLRTETFRASGPGGQYVNKRETAVRIIHIPSGIMATCQIERSQEQNKIHALSILKARLSEKIMKDIEKKIKGKRRTQIGKAGRSEKIRTYNFPQNRITDHRVKKSWHNIEAIMNGKLDPIIKILQRKEK